MKPHSSTAINVIPASSRTTVNPSAEPLEVSPSVPLLISRKELSVRWGGVSQDTIRRREKEGMLQPIRFGPNIVRYHLEDVERYEQEATSA